MPDLALLTTTGTTATLTLNRPDARNALSVELLEALHARLDELAAMPEGSRPSVLVLTGAGKSFCAGMDLKMVLDVPGAPAKLLHSLAELTLKLRALPMATIAKVNGAAIGGGCGLSCVCDFAITHADSKMGYPEVDLGVCPAVVAPWLVRKVGAGRARTILLMGGTMSGQRAHELRMVDVLAPTPAELDAETDALVARLSSAAPQALRATKQLLNELDGSFDAEVVRRGADLSAKVVMMPETREMLRAKFAAKS
ncbi:MAG TPA: enoyl-CoA hydratase/isomerase family protein [Phycisphaerales bacterium]|nr:enoyl-CoA hydratase/isomerase family protein [Phycisphaerales bacterium]